MLLRIVNCSVLWRTFAPQTVQAVRTVSTSQACSQTVHKRTSQPKYAEKVPDDRGCPLCRAGLHKFGYRDVLLLRQFVTPDGYLIGRRQTGVCPKMQRRITKAIRRSRQLGLLPNFKLSPSDHEPASVTKI